MGRLGSGLNRHAGRVVALLALVCTSFAGGAGGVGIEVGLQFSTLDLSIAFTRAVPAAQAAFDQVYQALVDLGLPSADLEDADDRFEEALSGLEDTIDRLPPLIPVPHLGLSVEIPLHLLVIDDLRLSAGFVSDLILYTFADQFGIDLPPLQFDTEFEFAGNGGSIDGGVSFTGLLLATEVTKRFDLLVFAFDLGGGIQFESGSINATVDVEGSPGLQEGLDAALAALHPEGLSWSSFGVQIGGGVEVGPPFLRLSAGVRFSAWLVRSSGYWGLRSGGFLATLGMVIRF